MIQSVPRSELERIESTENEMKRRMNWMAILVVAVFLYACGEIDEGGPEVDGESNCPGCTDWQFDDEEQEEHNEERPEGGDGDSDEPREIVRGLAPCAPKAVVHSEDRIPVIPEEVTSSVCPLEREVITSYSTYSPGETAVNWNWNGDELERVERKDGRVVGRTIFRFDEAGGEVQSIDRRMIYTHFSGVHNYYDDHWEFDEQGRLLRHESAYGEVWSGSETVERESELTQKWEGELLVERRSVNVSESWESDSHWRFDYDEQGRLVEINYETTGQPDERALWSYEGGLPAQVSRFVDGVLVERQSWEFAEGQLLTRRVELGELLADLNEDDELYWRTPAVLDSYALQTTQDGWGYYGYNGGRTSPWSGANAHLEATTESDCYDLPTTLGHGYPEDEGHYFLGISDEVTPEYGLEHSYGFRGYYYGYGNPAWYGHLGVGTAWPTANFSRERGVDVTVVYDKAGQMISESMSYIPWENTEEVEVVNVYRVREFQDSRLLLDEIEVEKGGETVRAALHFERDDRDRLVRRERSRDDEYVSHQEWSYEDGAVVESLVHAPLNEGRVGESVYYSVSLPEPGELVGWEDEGTEHTLTMQRSLDERGREVRYHEDRFREGSKMERRSTWGEHGKIEETVSQGPELEYKRHTYWEYHESGEVLRRSLDHDGDDVINSETRYVRDESGLALERIEESGGEIRNHETREFSCVGG